ncbi:MAG: TPM domain-containing protein [Novosphingobium sp.]
MDSRTAQLTGRWLAWLAAALALVCAGLAYGQSIPATAFPALTGRVVDAAHIIPADEAARLDQKLAALEQQSHRQLVVATVPDLQGYDIADYGYQLGRAWGIGEKATNNGAILLVAPKERKVRIEIGYGLEGVLTDGFSTLIIQQQMLPRFKAGDMPGGIEAGVDAVINQLVLPEDEARKIAAQPVPVKSKGNEVIPALMWLGFIFLFIVLPMIRRSRGGSSYQSSGLGPIVLWNVLDGMSRGGGGSSGGDWGGGGGGGFSGGGGSFGGGGASGSW